MFPILIFWIGGREKLLHIHSNVLSFMVHDILSIPMSTVALKSSFSTRGRVFDQFHSSLTPKIVKCLICAQDWLRSSPNPIEIKEKIEMLEEIEIGKRFLEVFFPSICFLNLLCFDHII